MLQIYLVTDSVKDDFVAEQLPGSIFKCHQAGPFWLAGEINLFTEITGRCGECFMTDDFRLHVLNSQIHRARLFQYGRNPDLACRGIWEYG